MPKPNVKKEGRRMLVAAIAGVQLAASNIRTGWVTGTKGQHERDEGVRESQEKLRVIMRMWLTTVQDLIVLLVLQSKHRTAAKQNSKAPHKTQTTPNQQNNHKSKP